MLFDIHTWTSDEFDKLRYGDYEFKTRPVLGTINLKYYCSESSFVKSGTKHMYFGIIGDKVYDENFEEERHQLIALAQLSHYDYYSKNAWAMPYITVHPSLSNQGIGRQLYSQAVAWLKEQGPDAILYRTANSESGQNFQHVADTVLFQHQCPWTQEHRDPDNNGWNACKMLDFKSVHAQCVNALQCHDIESATQLILSHPNYDWNQHNDAYVYPLEVALLHTQDLTQLLLQHGALPNIDNCVIGYKLADTPAYINWLQCFDEPDQGVAFILSRSIRTKYTDDSTIWKSLSHSAQEKGSAFAVATGASMMRGVLDIQDFAERNTNAWTMASNELAVRTINSFEHLIGLQS